MNDADKLMLKNLGESLNVLASCMARMVWGQHELMDKVSSERARMEAYIREWQESDK